MNNIFKWIRSLFTSPSDSSGTKFSDLSDIEYDDFMKFQKQTLDELNYMVDEIAKKTTMQRNRLEALEDFLERIGLEVPPELDDTELNDDEATDLLSIYASIVRKIITPIWEECEKAGTDAVGDLVEAVNQQMEELS